MELHLHLWFSYTILASTSSRKSNGRPILIRVRVQGLRLRTFTFFITRLSKKTQLYITHIFFLTVEKISSIRTRLRTHFSFSL